MAFFEELDTALNEVVGEYLLNNQDLCKLLYYYPKDEGNSFRYNPIEQPNITDISSLLMNYIYPMPKSPDAQTKEKCFISVALTGGEEMDNKSYRRINLVFDIICHLDVWMVQGGYRPFKIANKIDIIFNDRNTKIPTVNKIQFVNFVERDYSYGFWGVQLVYELQVSSNISNKVEKITETVKRVPSFVPKNQGSVLHE